MKYALIFLLTFIYACGLTPPQRTSMDKTDKRVVAAHIVAEEALNMTIDLDLVNIWRATQEEMRTCGGEVNKAGCFFGGNILVNDVLDIQSFCMILAHELVHAGAYLAGLNTDGDHKIYNWHHVLGHPKCTILGRPS